jgi:5-methylcytosine-specific restriction endonuclease McrA
MMDKQYFTPYNMAKIPKTDRPFWTKGAKTKVSKVANHAKLYNSARWKAVREKQMKIQPLCEACLKNDLTEAATQVDHIKAITFGGSELDLKNLQSLCYRCHGKKSKREQQAISNGLTIEFSRGVI